MEASTARTYAGQPADARAEDRRRRLMDAGLDLLTDPDNAVSVRSVCRRSGLVARYFYESFADRDALVDAVFDEAITGIASSTLMAIAVAPPPAADRVRAGLANIIDVIADDPRLGRLFFSPLLTELRLAQRRAESTGYFSGLLAEQSRTHFGVGNSDDLQISATFAVGGLSHVLAEWLRTGAQTPRADIVEACTDLFVRLSPEQ